MSMSYGGHGDWMDADGACKVCGGEIPHGHAPNCDVWKQQQQLATLTAERDGLRDRLTFANAMIGALNGYRNEMANAFNQYGAARGNETNEQIAAEMFWDADKKFNNWLTGHANRQAQEETRV